MEVNKMLVDERIQIMSEFQAPADKGENIKLEALDINDEISDEIQEST